MDELNAPMVYLAPDRHAFLVLGDGDEPLITWSMSYRLACEQADVHGALVVAVPVVHDASWRQHRQGEDTQVAVPAAALPRKDATPAGFPLGRRGQGSPDGWSSKRDEVVGQDTTPVGPASGAVLGERFVGTAPVLARRQPSVAEIEALTGARPMELLTRDQYEESLREAFAGVDHPREAVVAFHTPAADGVAVLSAVLAGLVHLDDEATRRPAGGPGHKIGAGL